MSALEDQQPKLYPAWRQAEADLIAQGLSFGSIVTDDFLREAFGIKPARTINEHEKNKLVFLRQITALKDSLLETRKMLLVDEPGVGYRVALPEEQTRLTVHRRGKEIKRALSKMVREVTHVDTARLNDGQRKENADALAKLGGLRRMARKQLKGPSAAGEAKR